MTDLIRASILTSVLILMGCGAVAPEVCTPGKSEACIGPAGCAGGQVCNSEGSSFEPCQCGNPPPDGGWDGGGGAGGGTGSGSGGGTGGATGGGSGGGTGGSGGGSGSGTGGGAGSGGGTGGGGGGTCAGEGNTCLLGIVCHVGQISCATGSPVCTDVGNAPNGTMCNDLNSCTQVDQCLSGSCVGSNPVTCATPDQCHDVGVCNPSTGVCSNPVKAGSCTPTDLCFTAGQCQADGSCLGTTPKCTGDLCNTGSCSSGVCSSSPLPNGQSCGLNQVCNGGVCTACVANTTCTPTNACHNGRTSCTTGVSVCVDIGTNKVDGTSCDDGSVCTQTDYCVSGSCTGHISVVNCTTAPDQCRQGTALACNPVSGCPYTNQPNGTPCNVFNSCQNGVCTCGLSGGQCCPSTTECLGGAGGCYGTNSVCTLCGATGQQPCQQPTTLATHCLNPSGAFRYCCRTATPASGSSPCP